MQNNYNEIELIHSFIKDLSLQVINPLELLDKHNNFDTNISTLGIKSRKLNNEKYEVVSDCKIVVKNINEDKILTLFIEYSGIFNIHPIKTNLKELLYVNCASALYPFLRYEVIYLTSKIGMQPIMLPYINFKSQYYKMKAKNSS